MKTLATPPAHRRAIRPVLKKKRLPEMPCTIANIDEASPELEAALLKAVRGPHKPFSELEFRAVADRVRARCNLSRSP